MRRRAFLRLLSGAAALPLTARAQQPAMPVIGVLGSAAAAAYTERLNLIAASLEKNGFVKDRNVAIEFRWADGHLDLLPALASDLVAHKVNIIIATGGLQAARAALSATRTIPIVFSTDGDPIQQGLVASLNKPSGNATGITTFTASLTTKRLEIIHELLPRAKIIGALVNSTATQAEEQLRDAEYAVHARGLEFRVLNVSGEADFEPVLSTFGGVQDSALLVAADPLFIARRELLVAVANRQRIAAIFGRRDFASAGGLISYGADLSEPYRQMGVYVARILKGDKPGELPVVEPTKFDLVLNLKTAKALGIAVPPTLLTLADEVID